MSSRNNHSIFVALALAFSWEVHAAPPFSASNAAVTPDARTQDPGAEYYMILEGKDLYVFLDGSRSPTTRNNFVNTWFWTVFEGPEVAVEKRKMMLARYFIDCQNQMMMLTDFNDYSVSGAVIRSIHDPKEMQAVAPNTIAERMLKAACMPSDELVSNFADYYGETPREAADNLYNLVTTHKRPNKIKRK